MLLLQQKLAVGVPLKFKALLVLLRPSMLLLRRKSAVGVPLRLKALLRLHNTRRRLSSLLNTRRLLLNLSSNNIYPLLNLSLLECSNLPLRNSLRTCRWKPLRMLDQITLRREGLLEVATMTSFLEY